MNPKTMIVDCAQLDSILLCGSNRQYIPPRHVPPLLSSTFHLSLSSFSPPQLPWACTGKAPSSFFYFSQLSFVSLVLFSPSSLLFVVFFSVSFFLMSFFFFLFISLLERLCYSFSFSSLSCACCILSLSLSLSLFLLLHLSTRKAMRFLLVLS